MSFSRGGCAKCGMPPAQASSGPGEGRGEACRLEVEVVEAGIQGCRQVGRMQAVDATL